MGHQRFLAEFLAENHPELKKTPDQARRDRRNNHLRLRDCSGRARNELSERRNGCSVLRD
jgi:hypothetical protein